MEISLGEFSIEIEVRLLTLTVVWAILVGNSDEAAQSLFFGFVVVHVLEFWFWNVIVVLVHESLVHLLLFQELLDTHVDVVDEHLSVSEGIFRFCQFLVQDWRLLKSKLDGLAFLERLGLGTWLCWGTCLVVLGLIVSWLDCGRFKILDGGVECRFQLLLIRSYLRLGFRSIMNELASDSVWAVAIRAELLAELGLIQDRDISLGHELILGMSEGALKDISYWATQRMG